MKRWIPLLVLLVASLVFAAGAVAQGTSGDDDGFIFRANGDVTVAPDDVLGSVIVANGNAIVDGEVTDTLWVISGDAVVEGTVGADVVVIDGTLSLAQSATVENVTLIRGTLDRAEGAIVTGDITEQDEFVSLGWGAAVFSMMMWFGVTLALVVAAVLFAWFGRQQLAATGTVLRERFGASTLTGLALWVGLPILAVMAFVTVIGIPLGVAIFLFVLPVLWFVGFLITTAKVGEMVLRRTAMAEGTQRVVVAAALGVVLFQIIGLVPGIGPLVTFLAGLVGSGALVYRLVERPRRQEQVPAEVHPRPAI